MEIHELSEHLHSKRGAVLTLENGIGVRHSYRTMHEDVLAALQRLVSWGVTEGCRVGIFAPNSYWWLVYDLALIRLRAVSIPFSEDFRGAIDDPLLERHGIALLLTSRSERKYFPQKASHIAFIDAENGDVQALNRPPVSDADREDQLSLVFSSGSAGGLKGLVISRTGTLASLPPILDAIGCRSSDRFLLFLPLSGFQQRFLFYGALWYDFDIILTDFTQLFAAMQTLNPTILLAPPIFYQMAYAEAQSGAPTARRLRSLLANTVSLVPSLSIRRRIIRWLFPDFVQQFGASVRILITGMAPLQRDVLAYFDLMQLPISEAYGMVESGVIAYRSGEAGRHGSVGSPLRGATIRFGSDQEIIVERENPVALRYFQCAEGENERTFVAPNRTATGDIGFMDEEGFLHLTGRKKEIIVTASGYKVHPEVIENELNGSPDVASSVVFMEPGASNLTTVIVLANIGDGVAQERVRRHAAALKSIRGATKFLNVIFADGAFTRENGLLRPNMKLDRRMIIARYGAGSEAARGACDLGPDGGVVP